MSDRITWIHPSYRDLVIDELTYHRDLRNKFLQKMSLWGIQLAISDTGGAEGSRSFPFMIDLEDWMLLRKRCLEIVSATPYVIPSLLTMLSSAASYAKTPTVMSQLSETIETVCEAVRDEWDSSNTTLDASNLRFYSQASLFVKPLPPFPKLDASWQFKLESLRETLESTLEYGEALASDAIESWVDLVEEIYLNEPRFLRQISFPSGNTGELSLLIKVLEEECKSELLSPSYDELTSEMDRIETLSNCVKKLMNLANNYYAEFTSLWTKLVNKIDCLQDQASELKPMEPDDENGYDLRLSTEDGFDIDALFADL